MNVSHHRYSSAMYQLEMGQSRNTNNDEMGGRNLTETDGGAPKFGAGIWGCGCHVVC